MAFSGKVASNNVVQDFGTREKLVRFRFERGG